MQCGCAVNDKPSVMAWSSCVRDANSLTKRKRMLSARCSRSNLCRRGARKVESRDLIISIHVPKSRRVESIFSCISAACIFGTPMISALSHNQGQAPPHKFTIVFYQLLERVRGVGWGVGPEEIADNWAVCFVWVFAEYFEAKYKRTQLIQRLPIEFLSALFIHVRNAVGPPGQ